MLEKEKNLIADDTGVAIFRRDPDADVDADVAMFWRDLLLTVVAAAGVDADTDIGADAYVDADADADVGAGVNADADFDADVAMF